MLSSVQGQGAALKPILAGLSSKHLHHAWLFHGPEGVGKELTALGVAQALLCTEKPGAGCDKCSACQRVHKRMHPDVTWVMPEDEQVRRGFAGRSDFAATPSRDIRIEQIRKLQERLSFRALEGISKLALIATAHAMNPPAQNALLKTLEEPAAGTVLILISSSPEKLLPTIRSRCAKATFGPLSTDVLCALLNSTSKLKAELHPVAAQMALGSASRALSFSEKQLLRHRAMIEEFEALTPHDARLWLALAEELSEDKTQAEQALDVLQIWIRDVSVAQVSGPHLVFESLQQLALTSAQKRTPRALAQANVLIDEARNAITQRNGGTRLQLERLFIEMLKT
jgi:DNA polymerase III subunit delta'